MILSDRAYKPNVRFDPVGYKKVRRAYEYGDPRPLIRMMRESYTDSHVWGCVNGRRAGFKSAWMLEPADDSSEAARQMRFVEDIFQDGRFEFYDMMEAIHNARLFLYSVLDFEWRIEDGQQVPARWEEVGWWHFRYDEDNDDRLMRDFGYHDLRPIPPSALVCEVRGLPGMLPVLRDWILADFGIEAWASFIENVGEPFILGKYPAGVDDPFKDEVERAVKKIARSARGTAPEGTDIEMVESGRSSGDHQAFRADAKAGISLALLGHENAVKDEGGVNVGGEDSGYQVRRDIALDDIRFIEPCVQRLIDMIVRKNFAAPRAPLFSIDKEPPLDKNEHMEAVRLAWRVGAPVKGSELRKLGLDVPPDETYQRPPTAMDTLMPE